MKPLPYAESSLADEVWIDMMRTSKEQQDELQKVFGKIPSPLPNGKLKVKFFIYKKKPSFIRANGVTIKFTYDIKANLSNRYVLHFYDTDTGILPLSSRSGLMSPLEVKDSCYPKKVLIKQLLNSLIQ